MANNQILKSIVDNYMNVLHEGDFEEAKRYCTIDCDMKDIFEKKLSDEEVLINEFGDEVIDEYKETKKVYYNILCGKYEITKIEKMQDKYNATVNVETHYDEVKELYNKEGEYNANKKIVSIIAPQYFRDISEEIKQMEVENEVLNILH